MAEIIALASKNYAVGKRSFGPYNIPVGLSKVTIAASRDTWLGTANSNAISLTIDLSLDGGITWVNKFLGFTAIGTTILDELAQPILSSSATREIPEPTNPNRKFRGEMNNYLNLKTQITVTVE